MASVQVISEPLAPARSRESFFVSALWSKLTRQAAALNQQPTLMLSDRPSFYRVRRVLGFFPVKRLSFLSSELAPLRSLWPERLDLDNWGRLVDDFTTSKCDEVVIPALSREAVNKLSEECTKQNLSFEILSSNAAFAKSLQPALNDEEFIATFGTSTRALIRKGLRSQVATKIPISLADALQVLEELFELHQTHWISRGERGAFCAEEIKAFHRQLVLEGFEDGQVFLLGLQEDTRLSGIVYCFLHDGCAYQYQSARSDNSAVPSLGIALHFKAMLTLRARGFKTYDFMAGANQLKSSLSDIKDELFWVQISRPSFLLDLERRSKQLKRWLNTYIKRK